MQDAADAAVVAQMKAICDQFETYGYRRVGAELRHRGMVVNAKKVRRLMREHTLNPKRHRRFIATTDSNHNYPICPNLAPNMTLNGPNQLWVVDITYVAITNSFVYLAVILDAWSRRVVGYAISRSIDARVVTAALKAAINARDPPRGCVHHSDRGSQYTPSETFDRAVLREHGFVSSHGPARPNPYDNAKSRELHEDPQGRSRVSDGLRNVSHEDVTAEPSTPSSMRSTTPAGSTPRSAMTGAPRNTRINTPQQHISVNTAA